jgi:hypothetical protein
LIYLDSGRAQPRLFQTEVMKMFWLFLIGAAVGAGVTALSILLNYEVHDREWWEEHERKVKATDSCLRKKVAENAQLRVALAAGEATEDAKKVAAMTMAAFEADITTAEESAEQGGCAQSNHCS